MAQVIKNRELPKVALVRNLPPAQQAVLSKLVQDNTKGPDQSRKLAPDHMAMANVFNRTVRNVADANNLFQVLPDMELCRQILVSAVAAPADLTHIKLVFNSESDEFSGELLGPLTRHLEHFFTHEFRMNKYITDWIDDILIMKGSHPVLIIPESGIDALINGDLKAGFESLSKSLEHKADSRWYQPKGLLGIHSGEKVVNFESFAAGGGTYTATSHTIRYKGQEGPKALSTFRVTDNLSVLREPIMREAKQQLAVSRVYGTGMEALRKSGRGRSKKKETSDAEAAKVFFRRQSGSSNQLQSIPTRKQSGGDTYGHPLVYHLAPEAVVPVHVPGDPGNHIGYFLLLDATGYPINCSSRINYFDDIRSGLGATSGTGNQLGSQMLAMVGVGQQGMGDGQYTDAVIERMSEMHGNMIEHDLLARLKAGMMGGEYEISRTDDINRLMLARALKNKMTTMLYVPAELMVYMAVDYNEFGVGKSLIEDSKILGSIRAVAMFANVMGAVNNAVPGKTIGIKLDPEDRNPVESFNFMLGEALAMNRGEFPLGVTHPMSMIEQIQLSAINVEVEGNPRFPNVGTTVTAREGANSKVDSDLLDSLRKAHVQVFSLTPEMVDGLGEVNFATTVVSNNLMLLKRVIMLQSKINPFLADVVRIFTYNSGILLEELAELIESNIKDDERDGRSTDEIIFTFLSTLNVQLAEPETDHLKDSVESVSDYSAALDAILPFYVTEDFVKGISQEQFEQELLDTVMKSVKAWFMRDFMRRRGIMQELDIFTTLDEENNPVFKLFDEVAAHNNGLKMSMGDFMKALLKNAKKRVKKMTKLQEQAQALAELNGEEVPPQEDYSMDYNSGAGLNDNYGQEPTAEEPQLDADGNPIEETPPADGEPEANATDAGETEGEPETETGAETGDDTGNDTDVGDGGLTDDEFKL